MDMTTFGYLLEHQGWAHFTRVVPEELVLALKQDGARKLETCREIQAKNGILSEYDGTAHHVLGAADSFDSFLSNSYLDQYVTHLFGTENYILHAYNYVTLQPNLPSYVQAIHRDAKLFTGAARLFVNVLVMLDPFTDENGATLVLPGSHRRAEEPDKDFFFAHAKSLTGDAGDIVIFDSHLWHAGGTNLTSVARAALTLTFSRPFIKQRMDYPRFLSQNGHVQLTPRLRQVLGFRSRTPSSHDEWYQPADQRLFQADQR